MAIQPLEASTERLTKIVDRRPVLWIGAGVSIGAGYPSTWKIVEALVKAADDPIDTGRSFYEIVDAVVASVGKGRVGDELQRLFQPACSPTPTHRAIARLAKAGRIDNILTTNYDDLLERALAAEGAPCVVQPLDRNDFVVGEGVRLLKVHGSYDDWRSVVLSGRSYAEFGKQYPFLRSQIDVLLRQRPVLFAGCSLQDPRVLDWIGELPDRAAGELKEWRALLTEAEWRAALAYEHGGVRAEEIFARTQMRPVIVRDHDHARSLWVEVDSAVPRAADVIALDLTVKGDALTAAMAGAGSWTPDNPLGDAAFVERLRTLRELDYKPLPTDDHGALAPAAAGAAAAIRALAEEVGREVTAMLAPEAQRKLAESAGASLGGEPPLLHVRVSAGPSDAERMLADRVLALPWELVLVDGQFPVERGTLDVAREAVVSGAVGLGAPDRELSVVAAVSAPVDASRLDHEGECYRLWRAMGSEERRLHLTDTGSLQALYDAMDHVKPLVLHFTGHGEPGALLFEDDEAHKVKVPVHALVDGLKSKGLPRLAFLASCHGASAARRDALERAGGRAGATRDAERGGEPASARLIDPALGRRGELAGARRSRGGDWPLAGRGALGVLGRARAARGAFGDRGGPGVHALRSHGIAGGCRCR